MCLPKITILMPVYNGGKFVREAINSILCQTFTDFEFIIIDDGSTDNSVSIVESYNDSRIILKHNTSNLGLIKSLNKGLELAKGKYIARMDADDFSKPNRLELQNNFMDYNHDVGVCGTWVQVIGEQNAIWKPPIADDNIRSSMVFENVIYHPTSMFRRNLLEKNNIYYNESMNCAEDYAFWLQWSAYTKLANVGEILLNHRIHPESIGATNKNKQQEIASQIRFLQIEKLGITPDSHEFILHNDISQWHFQDSRQFVLLSEKWLIKLRDCNKTTSWFPEPAFTRVLSERWYGICRNAQKLGPWTWKTFWQSSLSDYVTLRPINKIGFGLKCLLRI